MAAMDSETRGDLLEIIDGRASHRATVQSPASCDLIGECAKTHAAPQA
jgi:hypothetical protein